VVAGPILNGLAQSLLGNDPAALDDLLLGSIREDAACYREMASMALHDLVGRLTGSPMYRLLGARSPRPVQSMPCIFATDPGDARARAASWVEQGFNALKIKLFGRQSDLELINAVREVMPRGYIQGDLNGAGKTESQVLQSLPRLHEMGLTAIEDPLCGSLQQYPRLMELPARPKIIVDEPSRGSSGLLEVCRLRCCDAVNLHPNQQGTMTELLGRAQVTLAARLEIQIGGTGFTGVGAFAYAHIASALAATLPFGELGGARDHGMPASTSRNAIPIRAGALDVPEQPGHGGELDEDTLHRYTQQHLVFPRVNRSRNAASVAVTRASPSRAAPQ
jgi:L-alanine-DL-glutamate epimerase-like enolase superfamily enzyme